MKVEKGFYLTRDGSIVDVVETTRPNVRFQVIGIISHINESADTLHLHTEKVGHTITFNTKGREFNVGESWSDLIKKISIQTHPEYFI